MSTTQFRSLLTKAHDISAELVAELTPQTIDRARVASLEKQADTLFAELGQGIFAETDTVRAFFALAKTVEMPPEDRRLISEIYDHFTTCRALESGDIHIPFAKAHDHTVTWNMSKTSHVLIAGQAGYGKTELLRTMASELSKRQIPVFGIEGFPCGALSSFRSIAHTAETSQRAESLIHALWKEMDARHDAIVNADSSAASTGKICIFIDAYDFFAPTVKNSANESLRKLDSLLRKGQSTGLHFVYTVHSPLRDQLSKRELFWPRIHLGPQNVSEATVMWEDEENMESVHAGVGEGLAGFAHGSPFPIATTPTVNEIAQQTTPQVYSTELQEHLASALVKTG